MSYPLTAFLNPANALFSPKAIDRHRKDLSYNNCDFVVQQEVGNGFVAQVGYVGSEGHHLFDKYTVNLINPATGKRTLSAFGSFGLKANDGNNNFNALQASIQRRFVHGLLFQTNYMWSHGITDASDGSGTSVGFQDMACRACDRSSTDIDVRHTLTTNGVWELPFGHGKQYLTSGLASKILGGWSLSGLATARTGTPINITISRKAAALPDGNTSSQRPNLVPGHVDLRGQSEHPDRLVQPGWRFPLPPIGHLGQPGPLHRQRPAQLRNRYRPAEALPPDRAAESELPGIGVQPVEQPAMGQPVRQRLRPSSFGRITSILNTGATGTGAPRRIEFMLRAEF